ncbi:MAG: beta-propeller fold lactonase family protein [Usitatibacter sp.]
MVARTALYAAVGARLTQYDIDVDGAALTERGSITLPIGIQYAWAHGSKPFLYVACSDGGLGVAGTTHCLCALKVGPDGSLSPHGKAVPLQWRPVHASVDRDSTHVLVAYNDPSAYSVFRIGADGAIGAMVPQPPPPPMHTTAHQILVTPKNDTVLLPIRGTDAEGGHGEDPGSIEVFNYRAGALTHRQSLAPDGGFGFGPRHIDFHPNGEWVYLSIERQNEIALLKRGKALEGPFFRKTSLRRPHEEKPRQLGGAIHVHPAGHTVYVSNRADGMVDVDGVKVFNGAENTIAVYSIDAATGEPTLVQAEDTRGMHVRTFHIDPSGRLLVAANMRTRNVLESGAPRAVPGGLSVYRILDDGQLQFIRKYDIDVSKANLFWIGMVELART